MAGIISFILKFSFVSKLSEINNTYILIYYYFSFFLLRYQQAGFCLEELILLQPQNHFYHLKYAEILYTCDNITVALKEFCRVVELCEENVRALCGIKLVFIISSCQLLLIFYKLINLFYSVRPVF